MPTTFPSFEQWLDDQPFLTSAPDTLAPLYEHERAAARFAPSPVPACPAWCVLDAGHPYDSSGGRSRDSIQFSRTHSTNTPADAMVVQTERADGYGRVELGPVQVYASLEGDLTAEQARRYAEELQHAAELATVLRHSR